MEYRTLSGQASHLFLSLPKVSSSDLEEEVKDHFLIIDSFGSDRGSDGDNPQQMSSP